ncbi:shematrin-like protein 2 [Sphaerodactylus townsendi]|uniref:shematrin-like protein 2 n=1 Tax=Sphaerodactylus townsendi TaxID=933632 RepID=UPI002026ADEB|nr:shematrin-like protein 2 [Sphaerodactylus townsendi]
MEDTDKNAIKRLPVLGSSPDSASISWLLLFSKTKLLKSPLITTWTLKVHLYKTMPATCGPEFAVPSVASTPRVGFGSANVGWRGLGCGYDGLGLAHGYGLGYGYGGLGLAHGYGLGSGYGGLGLAHGYGLGYGYGPAVAETSGSLGTLAGVAPSCINQIPPAEVVVQPPPSVVTIPGPILSATGEPVSVGGNTPCAVRLGTRGSRKQSFPMGWAGRPLCEALYGGLGSPLGGQEGRGSLIGRRILPGRRGSICY